VKPQTAPNALPHEIVSYLAI